MIRFIACALILALLCGPAFAIQPSLVKEAVGDNPGGAPLPCPAAGLLDGSCASYSWFNICSGYIWVYSRWATGEEVGTVFGGPENPCVQPGSKVTRAITYYRNVVPAYNQTVDVLLHAANSDGCPDSLLASDLGIDPALRWNCSNFNAVLPSGTTYIVVRQVHHGGRFPSFATDKNDTTGCAPAGGVRSLYYGVNGSACLGWLGPTGNPDNFLTWIVVDSAAVVATGVTTWGAVKGLYR